MFDSKQILNVIAQWLLLSVVLAWEQSFSLPFLFLAFSLLCLRWQPKIYREVLFVLLGMTLATVYQFWFGIGVIYLFGLLGFSYLVGQFISGLRARITLASLLGVIVLAQVAGIAITQNKIIILLISGVIFWIANRFFRWEVRAVPLSKANWGWQKS